MNYKIFLSLLIFLFIFILSKNAYCTPYKDYFNRNLPIPCPPKKIVSLSPATTELICALGMEAQIAGVTSDCNFPPGIKNKSKIGQFGLIDMEKLIMLSPDLIIGTKDMGIRLNDLKKIQAPLLALETPDLQSIINNIIVLGKITEKEKQALALANSLTKRLKIVKEKAKQKKVKTPTVYYFLWNDPMITASAYSFIGDIINKANGDNIVKDRNKAFLHYNMETLLKKNPDVIIIPKKVYAFVDLTKQPYSMLKAVKNKKVLVIDDDIISRPAPRAFDALEQISYFLYN